MLKAGAFFFFLGLLFFVNGLVQTAKFRGSEARWERNPRMRAERDDPRGPPAWMVEQRIWLRFGHLSLRLGPGLTAIGLVLTMIGLVAR